MSHFSSVNFYALLINEVSVIFIDLTRLFLTSRDWDELLWAWKSWRDATGPKMTKDYTEFISLQNEAAKFNGQLVHPSTDKSDSVLISFIQSISLSM